MPITPAKPNLKLVNFRVEAELHASFHRIAQQNDQTAAQLFRAFMREYVATHQQLRLKPAKRVE